MFDEPTPDLVIHLAARVGGIGANQARPADLYLDNLLMGTYVLDDALAATSTPKTVVVGTICSYPKFTPVPFQRGLALAGLPRGDQRAVRHRQAGAARAAAGQPGAVRPERDLPDADQPVRAGRQVPSRGVSHVIPALIKKCVDAKEAGADHIEVWGTGVGQPRVPLRRRRRRGHRCWPRSATTSGEPVNLGTERGDADPGPGRRHRRELVGFEGEVRWDTSKPDGQPRRRVDADAGREQFGFEAPRRSTRASAAPSTGTSRQPRAEAEARQHTDAAGLLPAEAPSCGSTRQRAGEALAQRIVGLPAEELAGQGDVGPALGGSSTGRASNTISDDEPVTSSTTSANSRIVNSSGLPMLTGPMSSRVEQGEQPPRPRRRRSRSSGSGCRRRRW